MAVGQMEIKVGRNFLTEKARKVQREYGVLYCRPLHRDNWGLILVLRLINGIIITSMQCAQDS